MVWAELLPNRLGLGWDRGRELESLWLVWTAPHRRQPEGKIIPAGWGQSKADQGDLIFLWTGGPRT